MNAEANAAFWFQRKLVTLEYAEKWGNVSRACRTFNVSRVSFYRWKKRFEKDGREGLRSRTPLAKDHPRRIPRETVQKVLELRRTYELGPQRLVWYMERYHDTKISFGSVYRILVRHGVNRLPQKARQRTLHTRRYAKRVPGHHVQMDVKVLTLRTADGKRVRRYQYTAVDDATRVRALQVYARHSQANAIRFFDYVVRRFPFRINTIRTDRGHEWQALFHWHVEDQGARHVYIKPRSPQLNGKVERSHRTDQEEFYQLLTYKDDVDLEKKLAAWEDFYNLDRPHGAHGGRTPYEALRELLVQPESVSSG
jgi:transposase InsO family protein